jgi:exonuclease III
MAGEILHWNINGLKCKRSPYYKAKLDRIKSFLDNEKTLVLNIQKTHISSETELPIFLDYYKHLYHYFNDEYKIAFGINEGMLNNFILFHIKTTVFRN